MMTRIPLNSTANELRINIVFSTSSEAAEKLKTVKNELRAEEAKIVSAEIFAPRWGRKALDDAFPDSKFPINHILPLDETAKPTLAGIHITAVSGKGAKIELKETESGAKLSIVSDGIANWGRTFGIVVKGSRNNTQIHSTKNLELLHATLAEGGFKFTDITRTWFYNEDILSWYGDFNRARTDFWTKEKVFEGLLPASTGIGSPNPSGELIMSGALALSSKGTSGEWKAEECLSPLQCGATKYGSSFSRAVEIKTPYHKKVLVSGSASISYDGQTLFYGDIDKQIDLTIRVIAEILKARGMNLSDTVHAVIYCRKPEYYTAYLNWQKKNIFLPHTPSYSIVCRDDLMFEIELEAAKALK